MIKQRKSLLPTDPALPNYNQGLGTGLPNDVDYAPIELRVLQFLVDDDSLWGPP